MKHNKKLDKVKLWVVTPNGRIYTKTARPDEAGYVTVRLPKNGVNRAYTIPLEAYHEGHREFFYRLDEAVPLDMTSLLNVPTTLDMSALAAAEMLSALQAVDTGRIVSEATMCVKLPGNVEIHCTLDEMVDALNAIEGGHKM